MQGLDMKHASIKQTEDIKKKNPCNLGMGKDFLSKL